MRIDIDVAGDQQLSRELLRYSGRVDDASPAFRDIADDLRDTERRQFASEGGHGSGGWAPLAPATIARKASSSDPAVRGNADRILVATGDMAASLTRRTDPGHIEIVQPHQLTFGTSDKKAAFHQHGTSRMPQRRVLELRETDRRNIVRTLQSYMAGRRT